MNTHFNSIPFSLKNSSSLLLIFGACFLLTNCGKEKIDLEWVELNSGTSSTLTSVHFTDSNRGHIVGGNTWYYGIYLQTIDGGENWQMDTLGNKQLFGMHFNQGQKGHVVGIDGYLFKKDSPESPWNFNKLPNWNILRDVLFFR